MIYIGSNGHEYDGLLGQRVGRLIAIARLSPDSWGKASYLFRCDCGREVIKSASTVRSGKARSCGWRCPKRDVWRKHGYAGGKALTPTYRSWGGMRYRCSNPESPDYPAYGGRGITVCDRWKIFVNFLADMGERPAGKSIDRINNDGNYEPGNCRWATSSEQNRNRRKFSRSKGARVTTCLPGLPGRKA